MPLYEYRCRYCGFSDELLRRIDQRDEPAICFSCGKVGMKRKPTTANFTFVANVHQVGDTIIKPRGSTV